VRGEDEPHRGETAAGTSFREERTRGVAAPACRTAASARRTGSAVTRRVSTARRQASDLP
jgi:hypothetical protein